MENIPRSSETGIDSLATPGLIRFAHTKAGQLLHAGITSEPFGELNVWADYNDKDNVYCDWQGGRGLVRIEQDHRDGSLKIAYGSKVDEEWGYRFEMTIVDMSTQAAAFWKETWAADGALRGESQRSPLSEALYHQTISRLTEVESYQSRTYLGRTPNAESEMPARRSGRLKRIAQALIRPIGE